jgi:DNA modification methylase
MPTLNWVGKSAVLQYHRQVPCCPLRTDLRPAVGDGGSLLIQADNLLALKALLPEYAGRVPCVYIDPPYNTGSEKWIYNDNVNSPEIRRWLGQVVGKESEDLSRHDKWLCMMYPRLQLLGELLAPGGVLFISIDDNEVHNLRHLMAEVPEVHFVGCIVWERKRKGSHLSRKLTQKTEYILVYAKGTKDVALFGAKAGPDEDFPLIKRINSEKELRVPHTAIEPTPLTDGVYPAGTYGVGGTAVRLLDDVRVEGVRFRNDVHLRGRFVWTQEHLAEHERAGARFFIRTRNFSLRALKAERRQGFKALSSLLTKDVGTNEDATEELAAILGTEVGQVFPFPKPHTLVKKLIRAATFRNPDALVLDSFAGSGTTGHAVLALNREDGGRRRFILVEQDETICRTVTVPRLSAVIQGYTDRRSGKSFPVEGLGGGFRHGTLGRVCESPPADPDG